jgi:predicted nucleic acid-binding protein/GNAT superfamily N-acetyltransferase
MSELSQSTNLAVCPNSVDETAFKEAIELWKKYRATLGPFPLGAFEESARKGWILYLMDGAKTIGYLLYRIAKGRAVIVHLCVDEVSRGRGCAKLLFASLCNEIDDSTCLGIEVKCRRDYEIKPLWAHLGFKYVDIVPGRATKRKTELVRWFYAFETDDFLREMLPDPTKEDALTAVLDANIIFKLNTPDDFASEEACALTSDAITPYVHYYVTQELFIEIERKGDYQGFRESLSFAKTFDVIEPRQSLVEQTRRSLKELWGHIKEERDRSDLMHIAYSAAAGVDVFITQDEPLLNKRDQIEEVCGLRVLRPAEFITEIDQIENDVKYQPRALIRSEFEYRCPTVSDVQKIAECFVNSDDGEKRRQLEAKIRSAIARTEHGKVTVIYDMNGNPRAIKSTLEVDGFINLEILRHDNTAGGRALIQNLVWREISQRSQSQFRQFSLTDQFAGERVTALFSQIGFFANGTGWTRISSKLLASRSEVVEAINQQILCTPSKQTVKNLASLQADDVSARHIEEILWPIKLKGESVPVHFIPIQPNWALHLFDTELAERELLGVNAALHLNWENVYYTAKNTFRGQAGDRILWYVSSDKSNTVSEIRACSRILDVETAPAKELYKKYQRLGVYRWDDLVKKANGKPEGSLTVIHFYQTELFQNPISKKDLKNYNINGVPFGPHGLSEDQFMKIYSRGNGIS